MRWLTEFCRNYVLEIWRDGRKWCCLASRGREEKQFHGGGGSAKAAAEVAVRALEEYYEDLDDSDA